jgi:3-hydroxypropanoate dehydrogenase
MKKLNDEGLDLLFREARTHNAWLDRPVEDDTLRALYDLVKWGPTAANASPARFVFLRSRQAKERLRPSLSPGNVDKTMRAPVTVIVAYDLLFFEKLPKLFPHNPGMSKLYATNPQLVETTARRQDQVGALQRRVAPRGLGLDCGPMSGFDNARLDEEFFGAGRECEGCDQEFFPEGHVKSNFLVNLGYGDPSGLLPRLPRLDFAEACSLL